MDEHSFVYTVENGLSLLRIPSGKSMLLVRGPVIEPRGSDDGRWVVFHSTPAIDIRQVFVARVREGLIPREDWIPITGEAGMNRNAEWAPDGRRVYFLSDCGTGSAASGLRTWMRRRRSLWPSHSGTPFPLRPLFALQLYGYGGDFTFGHAGPRLLRRTGDHGQHPDARATIAAAYFIPGRQALTLANLELHKRARKP